MARDAHPPVPGPMVQPNFLAVMEAVHSVTFPISKRELLDEVGENTVLLAGRNVDLRLLLKELPDDYFESEEELQDALESTYADAFAEAAEPAAPPVLPDAFQAEPGVPGRGRGPAG